MASFDAGSIDGRLELDTDPFTRGLDMAEARADAFEATPIRKRVEIDDTAARAALDAFDAQEDERKIHQRVDVDTRPAERSLDAMRARERAKSGGGSGGGGSASGGAGGGGGLAGLAMPALIAGALGPIPALSPMLTGAVMGGTLATAGLVQFGIMAELEKSIATSAIKSADAAVNAKKASAAQVQIVNNLKGISDQWEKLGQSPSMLKLLSRGSGFLDGFIPRLQPIVNSITNGLMPAIDGLDKYTKSKQFSGFEKMIEGNAQSLLPKWLATVGKTGQGLVGVMEAVNPELTAFTNRVDNMAGKFSKWGTDGGAKKFFDNMNAYDAQFRKPLHQLGHDTAGGLGNLFGANGLGNPLIVNGAIKELDGLFSTLSHANMGPLIGMIHEVQSLETSVGHGINASGALPAVLNTLGALGKLGSQINWTVVGRGITVTAEGVTKLADSLGWLNQKTHGLLGDLAALGILGFGASKVPGVSKVFSAVKGSIADPLWVKVVGSPGSGVPGGGGTGKKVAGALESDAEHVAEGAGGAAAADAAARREASVLAKLASRFPGLARFATIAARINPYVDLLSVGGDSVQPNFTKDAFGGVYNSRGQGATAAPTYKSDDPMYKYLLMLAKGVPGVLDPGAGGLHYTPRRFVGIDGDGKPEYSGGFVSRRAAGGVADDKLAAALSKLNTLLDKNGNLDPKKIIDTRTAADTKAMREAMARFFPFQAGNPGSQFNIGPNGKVTPKVDPNANMPSWLKGDPAALKAIRDLNTTMGRAFPTPPTKGGAWKSMFDPAVLKALPAGKPDVWASIDKAVRHNDDATQKSLEKLYGLNVTVVQNTGKSTTGIDDVHTAVGTLTASQISASDRSHADLSSVSDAILALQGIMASLPGGVAAAVKGSVPTAAQITQAVRAASPAPATP